MISSKDLIANSQTIPTRGCHFADVSLKAPIEDLRMQEYAKASGFALDLSTLKWRVSDDESYVMVATDNGQIISTMRGEVIDQISMLEKKLECPWSFPITLSSPVLLLSRAATCSIRRSSSLNLVLRYWFIQMALHHKIRFIIGTFVAGSPRENSLREMGYQFFENTLGWQQSTYRSLSEVKVVILDLEQDADKALSFCHARAKQSISEYPFTGNFPELRYVRSL